MYVVVAEANNLIVIDYFIAFFCKVFYTIEMLKEVINWCELIPRCIHAIEFGCEVGGGYGSVLF